MFISNPPELLLLSSSSSHLNPTSHTILRRHHPDPSPSPASGGSSSSTSPARYIVYALVLLLVVNLLLAGVLLVQSRRIDRRLQATILATYQRASSQGHSPSEASGATSHATTTQAGGHTIPASRPPRGSFPSVHCPVVDESLIYDAHPTELSLSSVASARTRDLSGPPHPLYRPTPIPPPTTSTTPNTSLSSRNPRLSDSPALPSSSSASAPSSSSRPLPLIMLTKCPQLQSQTFDFLVEPLSPSHEI